MSALWQAAPRSAEARAAHAAAEAERRSAPQRYSIDPETVLERGLRGAAPAALGDDDWRAGFATYLSAARADGRLNALGLAMVAQNAVGRLRAPR